MQWLKIKNLAQDRSLTTCSSGAENRRHVCMVNLQFNVEKSLRDKAQAVAENIGIDLERAIQLFLTSSRESELARKVVKKA